MGVLFVILHIHGQRIEIFTLVSEVHENVDLFRNKEYIGVGKCD